MQFFTCPNQFLLASSLRFVDFGADWEFYQIIIEIHNENDCNIKTKSMNIFNMQLGKESFQTTIVAIEKEKNINKN
jgi:hypothetical protein